MATLTSRLKLRKPASTDVVNVDTDISANLDGIDAAIGYEPVTSGTRPATPYTGQTIFETDTGKNYMWNGTIWLPQYSDYTPPSNQYSHRNALHNGDMRVAQRGATGAGATGAASGNRYSVDRWSCFRSGFATGSTWTQTVLNTGSQKNGLRIQRNSGDVGVASVNTHQAIESFDAVRFQGKIVTLSFSAKCGANFSAAGSLLNVSLRSGTVADENLLSANYTGVVNEINQNITLTTSFQRFTITTTAALAATLLELGLQFGYTPVGTAGVNDWFEITEVQLEEGPVATPFEHRPMQIELALCQRYLHVATSSLANPVLGTAFSTSTTFAYGFVTLPVTMRVTPGLVTSGAFSVHDGSIANAISGPITLWNVGPQNIAAISLGNVAAMLGHCPGFLIGNAANASFLFSAEL